MKTLINAAVRLIQPGLAGNLFWVATAGGLSWLLHSIRIIYSARVLGPSAFGLLTFGLSVVTCATILVNGGLLVWGVRAIAQNRQQAGSILVIINGIQFVLACVAYAALVVIASAFFSPLERQITLVAGSILFAMAGSMQWVCMGLEQFKLLGLAQSAMNLLALLVTVVLVRAPSDVAMVPLITAGSQLLAAGVLLVLLHRQGWLHVGSIAWQSIGSMIRSSLPLGFSGSMMIIVQHANNLLLQFFRGPAALGLFSAPYNLVEIQSLITRVIANVFLPRLSNVYATRPEQLPHEIERYVRLMISVAVLPALLLLVEAPHIIHLLYGEQFIPAVGVLRAIGFALVFNIAASVYTTGLLAMHEDRTYFWSIGTAMLLSVGGGIVLVPAYGVAGATAVVASLDCAIWLVTLPSYQRTMHSSFLLAWVRPLLAGAALACWLLLAAWAHLSFWIRLPGGVALYLLLVVPWAQAWAWINTARSTTSPQGSAHL